VRIVIAHSQLNTFGGGERCVLELARRLGRRHEIEIWAGAYEPQNTYSELRSFPCRAMSRTGWLCAVPDADIAITHSFGAHLLALRFPRTVCYVHTMRSQYLDGGGGLLSALRRQMDHAALQNAAAVVTNSQYTARLIQERYRLTADIASPGVDEKLFDLPLAVGTYGLFVGRLAPEKGLERLLSFWRDVDAELKIVGAGDSAYVNRLRRIAGPRVTWCGPLVGQQLNQVYAASRFLVFTPEREEYGLSVLEAQASGKPVIATPEGGLPELVQHGVSGYLVTQACEFVDACHQLLHDDAQCLRMGMSGRQHARHFTWDGYANELERICLAVTQTAPRSSS